MIVRVNIQPDLLVWARERSGLGSDDLLHRFPKLPEWERGERAPTLKQLESYARATHTPVGFLFLPEPPEERLPIPDFRTVGSVGIRRPSPDLLDTIALAEERQEWYQGFAQLNREDRVALVGSLTTTVPVVQAAAVMREALGFEPEDRGRTWAEALRVLADHAEQLGVLVMMSGIVGSNTHRALDPLEFRGFALVDDLAPLVFVNAVDTKAAQVFTLCHELAHLWLGASALSDADPGSLPSVAAESWCNRVAAELLVPLASLRDDFDDDREFVDELERLAARYKVSTLVVLRRVLDAGYLHWNAYRAAYESELERLQGFLDKRSKESGGDFYNIQPVRVSKRFARAVIASTLEGQTLYRDAFRMLGFRKLSA